MEEKLFEGAGSRLKTVAKILFVVGIIATIILFIVFGWKRSTIVTGSYYQPQTETVSEFQAAGLYILIGGIVGTYINSLLIYGFGELIEEINSTKHSLSNVEKNTTFLKMDINSIAEEIKTMKGKGTPSEQ